MHQRLGADLFAQRRKTSVSQHAMAMRIGCSIPSVRLVENGSGILFNFERMAAELKLVLDGNALPGGAGIGESLEMLRRRRGISRLELSRLSGVSVPTVASLEKGRDCQLEKVATVATTLGVSLRLRSADEPRAFYSTVSNSSAHDAWTTPPSFLERLYPIVGGCFTLDPCSPTRDGAKAPVRARLYYTKKDDGLSLRWTGTVFMNPPYGREISHWVVKARHEVQEGQATSVFALLPARTDTNWWFDNITDVADVWLLRGRLHFGGEGGGAAPFASALVAWGLDADLRARAREAFSRTDASYIAPADSQDTRHGEARNTLTALMPPGVQATS